MLGKTNLNYELPKNRLMLDGAKSLSDVELLSIIIGNNSKEKSSYELAGEVLNLSEDMNGFNNLTVNELKEIKGITSKKAINILASIELGKRQTFVKKSKLVVNSPNDIFSYLKVNYATHIETVVCLYFSQTGKFLHEYIVSSGGINMVSLNINELVKQAIKHSASFVILAHNHPSNNVNPSGEDDQTTRELFNRLNFFEIVLIDHIIFSENEFYSYKSDQKL